ncbi:MAG: DNA internalization-related competence protein ComEC/Rec2 [Oscillospiraceae bacterium]|nr:DNA internalization-related competence protein ComEC/Rec2 [Oscillospiraceae bacterium]
MRKLMLFTIGFTIACAVGVYFAFGNWLLLLGVVSLVSLIALFFTKSENCKKAACILFGLVIGLVWLWGFDRLYLSPARQMDGQTAQLHIEVSEFSEPTDHGIRAEGKVKLGGRTYCVLFYINDDVTLSPGNTVSGEFELRYTGSGMDNVTYYGSKGIFLLAYPEGDDFTIVPESNTAKYFAPVLRHKILALMNKIFPGETRAFAKALLLGDTSEMPHKTAQSLRDSGIYHISAVSGMHVSILFALIYLLCGKQRVLTAVIGIPVLFVFAAVAGFSPSVVRAGVMQGLMILALLLNKGYDPPTALAAAVLGILAVNPLSITSVSFQLSVGCMVGIFLFSSRIYQYLFEKVKPEKSKRKSLKARLLRWSIGSISVTLGAMSLTMPLCAIYFGSISLAGIVANLLLLWLISLIFYGIMAACAFGALWLPLGKIVGWIICLPIRAVLFVAEVIGNMPLSTLYTGSIYIVAWLVFLYILLMVFLKSKKKHPWIFTGCLLVGLAAAVTFSWLEHKTDEYSITALDVGQGQCLILQKDDRFYVVDCGGDSGSEAANRAAQHLKSQGVFRIDGLIITHYDEDHAGGAAELLGRIPADQIYLPLIEEEHDILAELTVSYGDQIVWVDQIVTLKSDDLTIIPSEQGEDSNESSLCILFQPENCDILITGDRSFEGEKELMETVDLPDLEILVAGHHGSKTSTSWELLSETRPEVVIISVGANNRYGHPTWETLERLDLFGCEVYRTDLKGTVTFRG